MIVHLDEYVAMLGIAVLLDDSKKAKGVRQPAIISFWAQLRAGYRTSFLVMGMSFCIMN